MARLSHRRQSALVRVRSVLRLARRLSDVFDVFSLGCIRVAEYSAQRNPEISQRPIAAARRAIYFRRDRRHAARALSGLPRDRGRSKSDRLWAALPGATLLAQRADVVPMAVIGVDHRACRAAPFRPPLGRVSRPFVVRRRCPSGPVFYRPDDGRRPRLCSAGDCLYALELVRTRTVFVPAQPPAALCRLLPSGSRGWGARPRARPARPRGNAGAALERLACYARSLRCCSGWGSPG